MSELSSKIQISHHDSDDKPEQSLTTEAQVNEPAKEVNDGIVASSGEKHGCTEFTGFMKLPPELRIMIYGYIQDILQPQYYYGVALAREGCYRAERTSEDKRRQAPPPMTIVRDKYDISQQMPSTFFTAMAISSEMRKEVNQSLRLMSTMAYDSHDIDPWGDLYRVALKYTYNPDVKWFFNPSKDVFFFCHDGPLSGIEFDDLGLANKRCCTSPIIQAIRSLWSNSKAAFKAYLSYFRALEDIIVVFDITTASTTYESFFTRAPTPFCAKFAGIAERYAARISHEQHFWSKNSKPIKVIFQSSRYFSPDGAGGWDGSVKNKRLFEELKNLETSFTQNGLSIEK